MGQKDAFQRMNKIVGRNWKTGGFRERLQEHYIVSEEERKAFEKWLQTRGTSPPRFSSEPFSVDDLKQVVVRIVVAKDRGYDLADTLRRFRIGPSYLGEVRFPGQTNSSGLPFRFQPHSLWIEPRLVNFADENAVMQAHVVAVHLETTISSSPSSDSKGTCSTHSRNSFTATAGDSSSENSSTRLQNHRIQQYEIAATKSSDGKFAVNATACLASPTANPSMDATKGSSGKLEVPATPPLIAPELGDPTMFETFFCYQLGLLQVQSYEGHSWNEITEPEAIIMCLEKPEDIGWADTQFGVFARLDDEGKPGEVLVLHTPNKTTKLHAGCPTSILPHITPFACARLAQDITELGCRDGHTLENERGTTVKFSRVRLRDGKLESVTSAPVWLEGLFETFWLDEEAET